MAAKKNDKSSGKDKDGAKKNTTVDTEVAPLGYHEVPPDEFDKTLSITQVAVDVEKEKDGVASILSKVPDGKYTFLGQLGRGGMKEILRARDRDTGRDVAFAVIRSSKKADTINRFIQEAKLAANLEHPNIVPVHEIGVKEDGDPYFVMKLLGGENLAYIIDRLNDDDPEYVEKFNIHARMRIFIKICDAMAFSHSRGVAHLDLKPDNIQVGDFGEVLVLDWGLARVIGPPPSERKTVLDAPTTTKTTADQILDRLGAATVKFTVDGIVKGTPGYMAPEQVAGKNSEKDDKSDIYSLGAILYALLAFRKPIDGETPKDIMRKTLKGEIVPPSEAAPERAIPKSLEAVAMKAMATEKKNRYQSVRELSADVDAFLKGYATSAEEATWAKRLALVVKRHKALSAAIAAAMILATAFGAYVTLEYSREWGKWKEAFSADFADHRLDTKLLAFTTPTLDTETPPWETTGGGLEMKERQWLWLRSVDISGDCQITATLLCEGAPAPIEITLGSDMAPIEKPSFSPRGYSLLCGAWSGRGDIVSKNMEPQPPDTTISAPSQFHTGTPMEIVVTRKNGRISMSVDGRKSVSMTDFFPLTGRKLSKIGIRSHASGTTLLSLKVQRWALPEQTSPLLAGDTLLEAKLPKEAVEKYLTTAEDSKDPDTVAKALLKAFATASANNIPGRAAIMRATKRKMAKMFPGSEYQMELLEREILSLWKRGEFNAALNLIPKTFETFPETKIALKILQLPRTAPWPKGNGQKLLEWVAKTKDVRSLNISNTGTTSLKPIAGMEINALICSRNPLETLEPIRNMPLQTLHCDSCGITSLAPLQGMEIKDLIISGNKISDLSPLAGMPLERLRCRLNDISDLSPLRGMPLQRLECGGNKISDLSPLKNAPLVFLGCRINEIESLEPLRGMELVILDCQKNPIKDISPLAAMPLRELYLNDCPVKDLTPLRHCAAIETLSIPADAENIDFLRKAPSIRRLDTKWNIPMKSAAEFWKQWDAEHRENLPEETPAASSPS